VAADDVRHGTSVNGGEVESWTAAAWEERMRIALTAFVVGVLLLSGGLYAVHGEANAAGSCDASSSETPVEQQLVDLINAYRGVNGLPALTVSPVLARSAHWMANDLVSNDYFAHEPDSLGRSFVTRSHDCGVAGYFGENIAFGGSNPAQTLAQWEASPPHNAALLSPNFAQIGIAVDGYMWVADFGSQQSGTVPPPGQGTATPSPTATATATATPTPTPPASLLCPSCSWREHVPEITGG
jgi:Cysteine-rich secretory protein family